MHPKGKVMAMGTRQKSVGIIVILVVLLFISIMPGYAERGRHGVGGHGFRGHEFRGHGFRGHEFRGHGFRGHKFRGHGFRGPHRFGGPRVFIRPSIVVPFGAYWAPYWEPYGYPPVVVAPSPRVYVEPSPPVAAEPPPPSYWYYCEDSQAYYPYVQQCPGGWRPVTPTPP
jgi:hypothetical protein